MNVRLYATLRLVVDQSTVALNTDAGDTIHRLLDELVNRWPALKKRLFQANGEIRPTIHLFVNGRDFRLLGGIEMVIPANADICLFPAVGGGDVEGVTR